MAAGQIPFEPDQFTYIQRLQLDPLLIAVRDESPFTDLPGFYDFARRNPGELSIAGFGTTSIHFLSFSTLREAAGSPDIQWIAYDGSSDAAVAVLGGHVNATDNNYSVVREHVRAGSIRVLGVSSPLAELPDVPTYQEQGYDADDVHWRGIMGPAGMDPAIVAKVDSLVRATVDTPEFARFMADSGNEYGLMESPEVFDAWVHEQVQSSRSRLRALGVLGEPTQ
jgi:tripartite-type tricarboxylate transporter receptor subunit TctC